MATSGGEGKQDRARSHNRTPPPPPSRICFQTFPQNRNPKVQEGVGKGGGMAGQACVTAEGLEMEVDRSSRVVAAEQEARAGPAEQEARAGLAEQEAWAGTAEQEAWAGTAEQGV